MTLHDRYMQHHDYDSYVAIRAIAYAVQQTASIDPSVLSPFLRGDKFQLAAYKGRKLTFRNYNGQLRYTTLTLATIKVIKITCSVIAC